MKTFTQREEKKLFTYINNKAKNYEGIHWDDVDWYGHKITLIDFNNILVKRIELDFIPKYDGKDYIFYLNDKKVKLFQIFRMMVEKRNENPK